MDINSFEITNTEVVVVSDLLKSYIKPALIALAERIESSIVDIHLAALHSDFSVPYLKPPKLPPRDKPLRPVRELPAAEDSPADGSYGIEDVVRSGDGDE